MRRCIILTLAWLPSVLLAVAWVASSDREFGMSVYDCGAFCEAGGPYFAGPGFWRGKPVEVWARPAEPIGQGERLAETTIQRWKPFRVLRMNLTRPNSHTLYVLARWVPTRALALPALWVTRRYQCHRADQRGLCAS
jgi:hypothetical protein